MQNEDFYKPINIRDSIFAAIDLPEQSGIQNLSKKVKYAQDQKINKYGDQQDNEDVEINDLGFSMLGEVSTVQKEKRSEFGLSVIEEVSDMKKESSSFTRANSSQKQTSSQKSAPQKPFVNKKPVQQVRKVAGSLRRTRNDEKKQLVQQKKVVDLDTQIGQVRQWAHRDDNQEESDFDKSDDDQQPGQLVANKEIQDQLRKRAEQKVKMLQKKIQNKNYQSQPKGLGLKAKAQELRRKNQQNSLNSVAKSLQPLNQKLQHQLSTDNLKVNLTPQLNSKTQTQKESKIPQKQQYPSQSQQDPWQKINEKTKQQYQKKEQVKGSPLTKQQVKDFYMRKFIFSEEDMAGQFQFDDIEEQKVVGCWQMLFGCLKSNSDDQKGKKEQKNGRDRIAMRLVAISKMSLSNREEEFFILKQIWTKLTKKQFSRYGNHWNEIGFQGRDPATDLRSTGVLSLLQWYLFIQENHQKAKSIFEWTSQTDFPLALTHIKTTGLFLELIKNGKIKTKTWDQYQRYYNSLISNLFSQIQKNYDPTDNIGETLNKKLKDARKNITQYFESYQPQKQSTI